MNPDRFSGPQLSLGLAVVPRTLVGKDLANATLDTPLERNDCTRRTSRTNSATPCGWCAGRGTLARLIADFPNDRLLCHKRGHAFAVMASRVSDGTSLRSKIRHAWIVTPKGDAS